MERGWQSDHLHFAPHGGNLPHCGSLQRLRNGKTVGAGDIKQITEKDLVKLMVDKDSVFSFARSGAKTGEKPICLEVKDMHSVVLRGVSLDVRVGELVGIAVCRARASATYCSRFLAISVYRHSSIQRKTGSFPPPAPGDENWLCTGSR